MPPPVVPPAIVPAVMPPTIVPPVEPPAAPPVGGFPQEVVLLLQSTLMRYLLSLPLIVYLYRIILVEIDPDNIEGRVMVAGA